MQIDNNHQLIQELPAYIHYKTQKLLDNNNIDWMSASDKPENLFSFATQHLYTSFAVKSLDLKDKTIVITGRVADDGIGDYYHMIHTAEQIKKLYPTLKIDIIPHFDSNPIPKNLKILDPSQFYTLFCSSDALPQEAEEKVRDADLILDVSLSSWFKNKKNYLLINEYGNGSSNPLLNKITMGVSPVQLGIGIKEKPTSPSLLNLKQNNLKQLLFNTDNPSEKELDHYKENHELFSAYLKSGSYHQMALLYTITALSQSSPKSTLDICIPDIDMNILNLENLKKQGIGKLTSIKWDNHQRIQTELLLAHEGKEMRLINPYPLSQEDFHTLLLTSYPLIGCTGDNSLSEVLSFDLFPFYEIRGVKDIFWFDMKNLAGEIGAPDSHLKHYFEELSNVISSGLIVVNKLFMYYERMPRLVASLKDIAQTLQTVIEQMHFLNADPSFCFETKNLLQEIHDMALHVAQDPVRACLEGRRSNLTLTLKAKNIQAEYDHRIAHMPIEHEKAKELLDLLKNCKEACRDFFYDIKAADDDIVVRFKERQPKLAEAGERIAALMQNPELHKELIEFTRLLKTQYNYNLVLKDVIARQFALLTYPELKSYEKELFEKFKKDEIDAFTANKLLKEKIATLTQQ